MQKPFLTQHRFGLMRRALKTRGTHFPFQVAGCANEDKLLAEKDYLLEDLDPQSNTDIPQIEEISQGVLKGSGPTEQFLPHSQLTFALN